MQAYMDSGEMLTTYVEESRASEHVVNAFLDAIAWIKKRAHRFKDLSCLNPANCYTVFSLAFDGIWYVVVEDDKTGSPHAMGKGGTNIVSTRLELVW